LPPNSRSHLRALPNRTRDGGHARKRALGLRFDRRSYPHGEQEGSYYHGYYKQHIYHPLLVFDGESGHLLTALLRAGNTHSSNSSVALLKRLVSGLRESWPEVALEIRADGGFAVPALYDYCEAEGITYTVGLITNPRLEELAEELLAEAKESHHRKGEKVRLFSEGRYQAANWEHERRVVYKAEAMEKGTNTRFLVSTRRADPKELYEFYARRGESENWIKDLKLALKADRLSCHRFIANQFRCLILATQRGTLVNPTNLRKRSFAPLLEKAGLLPIRFHDLRHTCATLLLSRNVNPKIVSEMLGHATIAITLDTYSHVLPTMQDSATRALEDALR
jgi:hypothetical protein